jgi:hypothetical protein
MVLAQVVVEEEEEEEKKEKEKKILSLPKEEMKYYISHLRFSLKTVLQH